MKVSVEFKGHIIAIEKSILGKINFKIDGETQKIKSGFFANNLTNTQYEGEILSGRDKGDKVRVEIKTGIFSDTVTFFYNGEAIDSKELSPFL